MNTISLEQLFSSQNHQKGFPLNVSIYALQIVFFLHSFQLR